jgi:tetratricopeptide (TPR) repeat protein
MSAANVDFQNSGSTPTKSKPGGLMINSSSPISPIERTPIVPSSPKNFLGMEEEELIKYYFEPLVGGPFTLDLLWELVKDKFGPGDSPTPLFLSLIDRMQSKNIIQMTQNRSDIDTLEFPNPEYFTRFTTKDTAWHRYYSYWATQAAKINRQLRTNDLVQAFLQYHCFEHHFQNLFNKILTYDAQSEADASLCAIGDLLGGRISELCTAILPSPQGCILTQAIMNICNANIGASQGIAPSSLAHAAVASRPTPTSVSSRIDHAVLLRLNNKLNEACDTLCGAIVHARQLPRIHGCKTILCNALLQLALSQHDQLDRMGSADDLAMAMRENVKCLYEEVTALCLNMPRGVTLPQEIWMLKGHALTGLASLYAAADEFEEAHLLFSRAVESKKRAVDFKHPLLIDTLLGWSTLEKDEGNIDNARKLVVEASEIIKNLNQQVGEFCAAYSMSTARCMNSLALLYDDEDRYDDAIESYTAAQTLYSEIMGPHCLAVADIAMNLGSLFTSLGQHDNAMNAFQRAKRIYFRRFGEGHPDTKGALRSFDESRNALEMDEAVHTVKRGDGSDTGKGVDDMSRNLADGGEGGGTGMGMTDMVSLAVADEASHIDSSPHVSTDIDDDRKHTTDPTGTISPVHLLSHECADESPESGLTVLEQSISDRSFPHNVEFLMVQAELMWASECFVESRATYEEALIKCREQERLEVAEVKARQKLINRKTFSAQAKRSRIVESGADGGGDASDDDDEGDDDDADDEGHREVGSRYIVNRATLYIAEVLLCLGDLRDEMRGLDNEDDSAEKESDIKEKGEVVRVYEEALAIFRIALGEQDVRVADTLCKLGSHFANDLDFSHAEELFYEALTLYRLWWKSDRAQDVLEVKHLLARCLQGNGQHEEALELCQEVLDISVKIHENEKSHTDIANALNTQGSLLQEQNKLDDALSCYKQALEMYKVVFAGEVEGRFCHPLVARACNNMGSLYDDMGNFHEAKRMYEESLSILSEVHSEGHPQIAITVSNLASLLSAEGLSEEARPLYELALSIYRKSYGDNHVTVKDTLMLLERLNGQEQTSTYYCVIQ